MFPHLSGGWIAAEVVTIVFVIAYPLALAALAHRRFQVEWRYFAFGVAIFAIFQLLTRVPLVTVAGALLQPTLRASRAAAWGYLFALALTAALAEEIGRYLGYRWFMGREPKTWARGVMYGLGHGGLESIVIVGGGALLSLVSLLALQSANFSRLSAAQQHAVARQFTAIAALPGWFPLLGAWERLWTVVVHVALSLIVMQVFVRRQRRWLGVAIAAHFALDFFILALGRIFGGSLAVVLAQEAVVGFFGLAAVAVIVRLARVPALPVAPAAPATPAAMPTTD